MKRFIIILTIILFLTSCNWSNNTFILPNGFRGEVSLTYDIEGAQKSKTFIVPKDGKVQTSLKYKSGFLNNNFYMLDSTGLKHRLKEINKNNEFNCEELGIIYQRVLLNGSSDNKNSKYSYIFFVGTKKELNWCKESHDAKK